MYKYEVVIYWSEEDNAFIAEVPELAGCIADGESYNDALTNVQTIIRVSSKSCKVLVNKEIS